MQEKGGPIVVVRKSVLCLSHLHPYFKNMRFQTHTLILMLVMIEPIMNNPTVVLSHGEEIPPHTHDDTQDHTNAYNYTQVNIQNHEMRIPRVKFGGNIQDHFYDTSYPHGHDMYQPRPSAPHYNTIPSVPYPSYNYVPPSYEVIGG